MEPDIYSDGISEITITGPIIRIDLMSLSTTDRDAQGQPSPRPRARIIMPVEAFLNAMSLMEKVKFELAESVAVQIERSAARPDAKPVTASKASNSSPNFN